jgi:hypothetical protein
MPDAEHKRGRWVANLAAVGLAAGAVLLAGPFGSQASAPEPGTTTQADAGSAIPSAGGGSNPRGNPPDPSPYEPIHWRRSEALGEPEAGTLRHGVMLPPEGRHWISWDPIQRDKPNRSWRRWGTDRLVRTTLAVIRGYANDHPHAPRILIGDMSRPHGGDFGPEYGSIGHASHQNGLDVDVYYPRLDRREWTPRLPEQVDDRLAQDLVDRFVAAGAEVVFVGPNLPLTGPTGIVVPLDHHDDHLHFRLPGEG